MQDFCAAARLPVQGFCIINIPPVLALKVPQHKGKMKCVVPHVRRLLSYLENQQTQDPESPTDLSQEGSILAMGSWVLRA